LSDIWAHLSGKTDLDNQLKFENLIWRLMHLF